MQSTKMLLNALSFAALILAVTALAMSYWYDPFVARLDAYDFTRPEAAYRSYLQMKASSDIGALIQLEALEPSRRASEALESLEVHKDAEWEGKKVLFVTYVSNGVTKYDTPTFERDAERGVWLPAGTAFISSFDKNLSPVEQSIKSWKELERKD